MEQLSMDFDSRKENNRVQNIAGMYWTTEAMKEKLLHDEKWLLCGLRRLAITTVAKKKDKQGFNKYDKEYGLHLYNSFKSKKTVDEEFIMKLKRLIPKYAKQLANAANMKIKYRMSELYRSNISGENNV